MGVTEIEWCEFTFNPWIGCTKVSEGCRNCYAEQRSRRFPNQGQWGPGAPRVRTSESNWKKPLTWNRKAAVAIRDWEQNCPVDYMGDMSEAHLPVMSVPTEPPPSRPRVFCASLADWLDAEVPVHWRAELLGLIVETLNLDWLLLTKRPELWRALLEEIAVYKPEGGLSSPRDVRLARGINLAAAWVGGEAPDNVWVGTSVEDQAAAESRIPELLKVPARLRFLSCEPLLGALDLSAWLCGPEELTPEEIDWVIAGGESGPGARPMHPDWARSLRDQCKEAGVAFFFKQWGAWETSVFDRERDDPEWRSLPTAKEKGKRWLNLAGGHGFHGERVVLAKRKGKKNTGRVLDGRTWDEVPS